MAQQIKSPQDRFTDSSHDPYEQEANAIFNRPDMQSLNDQGDAIARDHATQNEGKSETTKAVEDEQNDAQNAFNYAPNPAPAKKSFFKRFSKKQLLIGGTSGGGILGIIVALFGISPFGGLINLTEVTGSWGDRFNAHSQTLRASKVYKIKYFSNPDDCGGIAVRCKLQSGTSDEEIRKLREAGADRGFTINDDDIGTAKNGKKYIKSFTFVDKTGSKVTVTSKNFATLFRKEPKFLATFEQVASMRGVVWRGKQALKKFSLFAVQRNNPIGTGTSDEENTKAMRAYQYGVGDENGTKAVGGQDENGQEDANKAAGLQEFNNQIQEQGDALREKALADGPGANDISITEALDTTDADVLKSIAEDTAKSTVKGSLVGAIGKIDSYCSMYQMVRIVSFGAKLYKARALIKYGGIFATMANQAKLGKITPEMAGYMGTIITRKSTAEGSKGKTLSDSDAYTLMTQGRVASKGGLARFTNGTPALAAIDRLKSILSTGGASAATCSKVKAWYGQAGLITAGVIASIGSLGTNAIVGAALGVAEGVIFGVAGAYLTPWLIQYAAGVIAPDPLTDPEGSYGVGNAIGAGMGAFGSQVARGNGMAYVKNEDFNEILNESKTTNDVLAAADEINNPTSPTERFTETMATALYPLASDVQSFDLSGALTSAAALIPSVLGNYANAAGSVDTYRGDLCADEDYKKLDIATDAFCNPIMAQSERAIDDAKFDPRVVLSYMLSEKGEVREDDGTLVYSFDFTNNGGPYISLEGAPSGDYQDFLTTCIDGDTPITADGYNADLSSSDTKDCVKMDDKYQYFRFFTTDTNTLDAAQAGVDGTLGQQQAAPASPDTLNVMTYNILGSTHTNDGGIKWETRLDNVITTVNQERADIIGFQEVSGSPGGEQQKILKDKLSGTYDLYPADGNGDTRPIYWNKSVFKLADKGTYNYPRYDNPQTVFPWVKLESLSTGKQIYIFNTHTAAGDKDYEKTVGGLISPEARKIETNLLAAAVKSVVKDGSPTVLMGDFNSTCSAGSNDEPLEIEDIPCTILSTPSNGFNDTGETIKIRGGARTGSEYATSHGSVGQQIKSGRHIDHVFFSKEITATGWKNIINDTTKSASDHTPVVASLNVPGLKASTATATGAVSSSGFAWVLGEANWKKYRSDFVGSHYTGGGFLGNGSESNDIAWPGVDGEKVYSILDGTVVKQPMGRATYKCTGTPNSANNGGIMIESEFQGKKVVFVYAHGKNVKFSEGETVKAGQQIMEVGNVGNSCGSHMHMDATYGGKNFCTQDLFVAMDKGSVNLDELVSKARPTCG